MKISVSRRLVTQREATHEKRTRVGQAYQYMGCTERRTWTGEHFSKQNIEVLEASSLKSPEVSRRRVSRQNA